MTTTGTLPGSRLVHYCRNEEVNWGRKNLLNTAPGFVCSGSHKRIAKRMQYIRSIVHLKVARFCHSFATFHCVLLHWGWLNIIIIMMCYTLRLHWVYYFRTWKVARDNCQNMCFPFAFRTLYFHCQGATSRVSLAFILPRNIVYLVEVLLNGGLFYCHIVELNAPCSIPQLQY